MTDREFKAIALLAFRSAESPTYDDFLRKVHRWYSRSFSTPLAEVEGMADEVVLRHYFEDSYAQLAEAQGDEARKAWVETRGRLMKAFGPQLPVAEDGMDDDEFWEKSLADEFARDNPDKAAPTPPPREPDHDNVREQVPNVVDRDGWTHQPNLEAHQDVDVTPVDLLPEDP